MRSLPLGQVLLLLFNIFLKTENTTLLESSFVFKNKVVEIAAGGSLSASTSVRARAQLQGLAAKVFVFLMLQKATSLQFVYL